MNFKHKPHVQWWIRLNNIRFTSLTSSFVIFWGTAQCPYTASATLQEGGVIYCEHFTDKLMTSVFYFQIWYGGFHPSLNGLLAWLFRLGTEPRRVHWCLLCLVMWHVAFGFTIWSSSFTDKGKFFQMQTSKIFVAKN